MHEGSSQNGRGGHRSSAHRKSIGIQHHDPMLSHRTPVCPHRVFGGNSIVSSSRSHLNRSRQWEGTDEGRIASSKPQMASLRLPGIHSRCVTQGVSQGLLPQPCAPEADTRDPTWTWTRTPFATLCSNQRPTEVFPWQR